jgi:hypothetical protein
LSFASWWTSLCRTREKRRREWHESFEGERRAKEEDDEEEKSRAITTTTTTTKWMDGCRVGVMTTH